MTRTETIVWHKLSDERPTEQGKYICDIEDTDDVIVGHWSVTKGRFSGAQKGEYYTQRISVYAWCKLPKGWQDE
jgi:hypothetical protein